MTRAPEPPSVGGVPASIAAIMAAIRDEVAAPAKAADAPPQHSPPGVPTTDGQPVEGPHSVPGVATSGAAQQGTAGVPGGGTPLPADIDATTRAILGPLLKAWLDAHLPEIVETAVHAEIRRLTGTA